ncbi:MAG: ATP-binding cassette domain-containing protein [Pseudonocardiaceae bacterium]|nr:ATP-binding cassette domain-containing protein [Pseudonocardiaceae bacterium]
MNLPIAGPGVTAPRDVLSVIWGRVLARDPVGPDDDLFVLGGGWFDAARASRLVRDALDVELAPAELAAAATPTGLANFIERRGPAGAAGAGMAAAPVAVSQLGMIWHEQLAPGSFNLAPFVRRLHGPLDRGALAAAFEQLVARHESLRTTFELRHGAPVQVVADPPSLRLPVVDLSGRAPATAETEAAAVIAEAGGAPFDLAAGPLFVPSLIRLGPEDHLLVVRLHHTVFDDWSLGVYRRELSALHDGVRDGDPAQLPELPVTFSEYARRQRRRLAGKAGADQLAWWRRQLVGAPLTTQLSVADPDGGRTPGPSEPVNMVLTPELSARLRALARHGRATPFMLLLAGFQLLLHRRTGQDDLLIASVVANRGDRDTEGLIGCFTKKLPLRLRLEGDPPFLELLAGVRDTLLSALAHQELGFEEVLQETLGGQAAQHGVVPHLPIMFQGLVPARNPLDLAGLSGSAFGSSERQGPGMHVVSGDAAGEPATPVWGDGLYPGTFLGISVVDDGEELAVRAQGGFHRPAVQALLEEFGDLLADVVARPLAAATDLIGDRAGSGSTERFLGFALNRPRLEQAIADCTGAREAALIERGGDPAEARLAARVVAGRGAVPDLRELRIRLWRELPGSIWPTELIVADGSPAETPEHWAASTEHESLLASAWAAQLGLPDLDTGSNYWQSFAFLDAVADARQRGLVVTSEQLARNRTLRTLAADLAATGPVSGTAEPAPAEVIRAEGLSKTYPGGLRAVDGLDLSVREGEVFGLLGPNGAGKTTTVGMLTTLVLPTGGRAFVGGVDVVADPAMAKQYLGVVPQANDLDNSLTVFGNLYFHGRYFGMRARTARARANRMLERLRLEGRGKDKVEQLSGGMLRRLQLARALMHGPAVAFLDEPTAGLDPQSRLALWDIVAELKAEGQTVLLTTHYMEEAERFCDRVAIMDHGRILALDTPDELKRSYGAAGIMLIRGTGDLAALAGKLAAQDWVHEAVAADGSVRVRADDSDGALSSVMTLAEGSGVKVSDVAVSEDSLEAVFISLTGKELRE